MANTKTLTPAQRRKRRLVTVALCAVGGAALGYACQYLPPAHQFLCHLAAKFLSLLGGVS